MDNKNTEQKKKGNNYLKIIMGIIIICSILIIGPVIVNLFMSFRIGEVYGDEGVWIPSLSTYYGAILGGVISGLLTLFGVRLTINTSTKEVNKTIREQQKIREEELRFNSVKEQVFKLYNPIIAFQNKVFMGYGHYKFSIFSSEDRKDFISIISENEIYADSNLYNELLHFSIAYKDRDINEIEVRYRKIISIVSRDIDTKKEFLGLPIQELQLFSD